MERQVDDLNYRYKTRFIKVVDFARSAGLAVVLCLYGACTNVPELQPHIARVEIEDQIDQASVIAVGVVENEYLVRNLTAAVGDEIGLHAVNVRLEGVLKGQLDKGQVGGDHLTFYYYKLDGPWNGPSPNFINPGERDIFYLIRDERVLRATTDAYLSHTRLESGKHPVSPVSDDQVHEAIARLLLLPGSDPDARYLSSLHHQKALALSLVGSSQVREMLQGLLNYSDGAVRGRACITLAEFPLNDQSCLPEIIDDPQTPPEDRERARDMLETPASP